MKTTKTYAWWLISLLSVMSILSIYLLKDSISMKNKLNNVSDGLDYNIMDVNVLSDEVLVLRTKSNAMQKRVDKLNSMLYNTNKKMDMLQSKVECQQNQLLMLRKEIE